MIWDSDKLKDAWEAVKLARESDELILLQCPVCRRGFLITKGSDTELCGHLQEPQHVS